MPTINKHLNINEILSGNADNDDIALFKAFLQDNESKQQPDIFVRGTADKATIYLLREIPEDKEKYKDSYIYIYSGEPTTLTLHHVEPDLTLKEIDNPIGVSGVKAQLDKLSIKEPPQKGIDLVSTDISLNENINLHLKENSEKLKNNPSDDLKAIQTTFNRLKNNYYTTTGLREVQENKYSLKHGNNDYILTFNQNILRREAANKEIKDETGPKQKYDEPLHHYEVFDINPFFVEPIMQSRKLSKSLGVVKLMENGNNPLTITQKHERVVKVDIISEMDPAVREELKLKYLRFYDGFLKDAGYGFKKIEFQENESEGNLTIITTMSFIKGQNLDQLNESKKELPAYDRIIIAENALASLYDTIHKNGHLHCDIKPGNFMVNPEDHKVQVIDFDDVILKGEANSTVRGTLDYQAPELQEGQPNTEASDVFAMGLTLASIILNLKITTKNYQNDTIQAKITQSPFCGLILQMTSDFPEARGTIKESLDSYKELRKMIDENKIHFEADLEKALKDPIEDLEKRLTEAHVTGVEEGRLKFLKRQLKALEKIENQSDALQKLITNLKEKIEASEKLDKSENSTRTIFHEIYRHYREDNAKPLPADDAFELEDNDNPAHSNQTLPRVESAKEIHANQTSSQLESSKEASEKSSEVTTDKDNNISPSPIRH